MTASSMGGDVMDGGWGGYGPGGGDGGCGGFGGFEFVVGSGRTRRWCVCRIKVGVDFVLFLLLLLGVYATRARAEDVGGGVAVAAGRLAEGGGREGVIDHFSVCGWVLCVGRLGSSHDFQAACVFGNHTRRLKR